MDNKPYSILIIDDHPLVTDGMAKLIAAHLEHSRCLSANNLATARRLCERQAFDLYIVDLEMPDGNGLEFVQRIRQSTHSGHILLYTIHEEPWIINGILQSSSYAFLSGALSKHADLEELLAAIRAIQSGKTYFGQVFKALADKEAQNLASCFQVLSMREKEVLCLLAKGLSSSAIAERMCLSVNTIQTYRKRLFEKMEAKNVVELVNKCQGLI